MRKFRLNFEQISQFKLTFLAFFMLNKNLKIIIFLVHLDLTFDKAGTRVKPNFDFFSNI
jgi:hypothetical protein